MSKSFLVKILIALSWLVAAVLWLLSVVIPDKFAFFNLNWAIVIIAGTGGIGFILQGVFTRKSVVLKRVDIILGTALILIAVVSAVFALTLPESYIWPIIAIVVTFGAVIAVIAVGGKKWDEGDNNKVGYKDYRTRKAEEENRNDK